MTASSCKKNKSLASQERENKKNKTGGWWGHHYVSASGGGDFNGLFSGQLHIAVLIIVHVSAEDTLGLSSRDLVSPLGAPASIPVVARVVPVGNSAGDSIAIGSGIHSDNTSGKVLSNVFLKGVINGLPLGVLIHTVGLGIRGNQAHVVEAEGLLRAGVIVVGGIDHTKRGHNDLGGKQNKKKDFQIGCRWWAAVVVGFFSRNVCSSLQGRKERKGHLVALSWHIDRGELLSVVLLELLGDTTLKDGVVSNEDADVCLQQFHHKREKKLEVKKR